MAIRERTCAHCLGQFSYKVARGADRLYCSRRCAAVASTKSKRAAPREVCAVEGCSKPRRSGKAQYCEMHYCRLHRNGSLARVKQPSPILLHTHGYRLVHAPGHRLATPGQSHVYEHRAVFYAAHGEGPFRCHWCDVSVSWETMHVDHVNAVKDDNRIENLVASCPKCNQWRDKERHTIAVRKRLATWIEFNGERMTAAEWADRIGISRKSLKSRMRAGWPLEKALTAPRGVTGPRPTQRP